MDGTASHLIGIYWAKVLTAVNRPDLILGKPARSALTTRQ